MFGHLVFFSHHAYEDELICDTVNFPAKGFNAFSLTYGFLFLYQEMQQFAKKDKEIKLCK